MRLALCLHRCTPFGGLESNALELARAALARGHEVAAFARSWRGERPAGLEVHELPVRAWTNTGLDRAFARALRAELAARELDVVVGFNRIAFDAPGSRSAARLDVFYAADPCLAALRPALRLAPNRRLRARRERELAASASATEILVQCERERELYARHYGTSATRLHVLPPGLRPEFLAPGPTSAPELRAELGVPSGALLALAVGSDFARKGLDRTLAALAALPAGLRERVWLAVVGSGRPARFARLTGALGLAGRVRFAGGRTDVLAFYRAADLLLHPAREENSGTVLLEAASQGVPVVCTAECGFAPLVAESGAGRVLASPFAGDELARATAELVGDSRRDAEKRTELGRRGRLAAAAFPLERRMAVALEVIERAARARRGTAIVPAPAAP